MDEINCPDMVLILRAQPDDGTIFMIKTFPLLVTFWELQAFFTPDAFYLLVIDLPALNSK